MTFDHPSLPEIVALQLRGQWSEACAQLTTLRQQEICLFAEVNRAICLFYTEEPEVAARMAPGLARLHPQELHDYDVSRLMTSLLVLAIVASYRAGEKSNAYRLGLEVCDHFHPRPGELPRLPTGVGFSQDGGLVIHEWPDADLIVYTLFALQVDVGLARDGRAKLAGLLEDYMRVEPTNRTAQAIFEQVLLAPDTPPPPIDIQRN